MALARRVEVPALVALPLATTIYLAFNAGGFFPFATGVVAAALAIAIALRVVLAEEPFAALSWPLLATVAAMTLLSVWTLVSSSWSHAPGRALVEFDRTLLYLLVVVAAAAFAGTAARLAWLVRALAAASFVVCMAGLISRVLPRVWTVAPTLHPERLSFPLTYWNAFGLFAVLGLLLCFHMTTTERELPAVRVAAAVACPLLASTALFTYSRAALAMGAVALLVYAALARSRALVGGALAAVPASAVALVVTYNANHVSSIHPRSAQAVAQGHRVALVLGATALTAGVARWLLLRVDARLARVRATRVPRRPLAATVVAVVAVVVAVGLALDVPGSIGHQYHRFLHANGAAQTDFRNVRARLTDPSNNGRLQLWDAALHGFHRSALHGAGAGSFELLWQRYRPISDNVNEAHSLYVETLAELGVVGLVLLVVAVLAGLVGLAARIRGPDRALYAGAFAAALTWAVVVGVDWEWEMPAVTLFFFALVGGALAGGGVRPRLRSTTARVAVAIGVLVVAITPARVAVSQARLDDAARALKRGDCGAAVDSALGSSSAVDAHAEPFEILAYCDVRLGYRELALRAMRTAVARDRQNWEYHYGMALVEGAAGRDPRPEIAVARRLNPREPLVVDALRRFGGDRSRWRREALASALPLD
jgi:O-antigen ligase